MSKRIEEWKDKLESAKKYREDIGRPSQWARFTDYFRHRFDDEEYIVNHIFSIGKTLIPQIALFNPKASVTPLTHEGWPSAVIRETLDNMWLNMPSVKRSIMKACYLAYLKGTAIFKIGYDSLLNLEQKDSFDSALNQLVSEAEGTPEEKKDLRYYDAISKDMPWLGVIQPENFLLPWYSSSLYDCQWAAHQMFIQIDELKAHTELRNLKEIGNEQLMTSDAENELFLRKSFSPAFDIPDGVVPVWEIFDRFNREHILLVENYDKLIWDDRDWKGEFPFVPLIFNPDPEYFWGIPDVRIIFPEQEELNLTAQMEHEHVRRSALKLLLSSDAIEDESKDAITNEDPMTVIWAKAGYNPATIAAPLAPTMSRDIFAARETLANDMREASGFSQNQKGESLQGRRTATESRIIQFNADIRMEDRRNILAESLREISEKMNSLVINLWTMDKVVPVLGPDMAPIWVSFKGKDLKGDFSMEVSISSESSSQKMQNRQDLMQLIPLLQGSPLYIQNPALQLEVLKMLLETFPGMSAMRLLSVLGGMQNAPVPIPMQELPDRMGGVQENLRARLQPLLSQMQGGGSGTPSRAKSGNSGV